MKTTFKKKEVSVPTYTCDVCGKESEESYIIKTCERGHNQKACTHDFIYSAGHDYDSPGYINLVKECQKCGQTIITILDINDIPASVAELMFKLTI